MFRFKAQGEENDLVRFGIDENDLPLELKVKVYNINSASVIQKLADY